MSKKLDSFRVLRQLVDNLCGLQADMRRNAATWKGMALAENPPVKTLRGFMHDAGRTYAERLKWVAERDLAGLAAFGFDEEDFREKATPLGVVALQLIANPLETYAACIAACDQILADVEAPESLWPE